MKQHLPLMILWLAVNVLGQQPANRLGEVEFFGYTGVDLHRVRAALPIHEGDQFSIDAAGEKVMLAKATLNQLLGHPPTDIAPTCCDAQGNWIIFIGFSGKPMRYNPQPQGTARLPVSVINLYERFVNALMETVQKGTASEDRSKGYALSEDPQLRSAQLEMRAYAVGHGALLRRVLRTASDRQQRIAAAELLGYARQSRQQLTALERAVTVRAWFVITRRGHWSSWRNRTRSSSQRFRQQASLRNCYPGP